MSNFIHRASPVFVLGWKRARKVAKLGRLSMRSRAALMTAKRKKLVGIEFDRFGRRLGTRLLARGRKQGLRYVLNPVSTFRYFEFDFARSCLRSNYRLCLDVGSPRLFSVYLASQVPETRIDMLNPDEVDLQETRDIVEALRIDNIRLSCDEVDVISDSRKKYDAIWSISVVEHIAGKYDDTEAVRLMYDALRSGGDLILTVPVDRTFREDFRTTPQYGIGIPGPNETYFFQRVYDRDTLRARLIEPLGVDPLSVRWFGETEPGRFRRYEKSWIEKDLETTVEDPSEMADGYREFDSWESMVGFGVCGVLIRKP